MNSPSMLARPRAPRAAFAAIVRNEARLVWRQPAGMIAALAIPLLLVVLFGKVSAFQQPSSRLGGLSAFQLYVPILISLAIALLAFIYLPGPLVSYREQGVLRRLSVTPVPASWVLAAQLAVQACLMLIAVLIIMVTSVAFFGLPAPGNPGGFLLALVLSIAAIFAIGLCIAAAAPTSGAVRGIMAAVLYPLLFFSGLYYPMQLMPGPMLAISHFTPLGAAVQAIIYPMFGQFPPAQGLLVLAAYALVFGFLAKRFFRWE
jgi:ABC-2 type transport system permease protein